MIKEMIDINNRLATLKAQKDALQMSCKHRNAVKKHFADTGNYDPYTDKYWTEFDCLDCGKHWSEDGSK